MLLDIFNYSTQIIFVSLIAGYLIPYGVKVRFWSLMTNDSAYYYQKRYIAFIVSSFLFEKTFISIYYFISISYGNMYIIKTGLALTILLILAGVMTNLFYDYIVSNLKRISKLDNDLNDRIFIMSAMTIVCALDFMIIDLNITLFCISLLLGKYFWFDSGLVSPKLMLQQMKTKWGEVSESAKNKSLVFALIVLPSDYISYIISEHLHIDENHFGAAIIVVIFSIGYILYCKRMRIKDAKKYENLKHNNVKF